ncbi:UNKNOWN [Stylonychia lemnae]|uniref:Uncharacterized protein n=1 Tax=Stylonychia lemnae TaxID=5949 RepID=A0A077ZQJ9_STYLE|nr:UNKNOWN [Stylonychia lemnae]|eukprot:CDW72182.1 UNKNOWN [Stylonychia lemnae]
MFSQLIKLLCCNHNQNLNRQQSSISLAPRDQNLKESDIQKQIIMMEGSILESLQSDDNKPNKLANSSPDSINQNVFVVENLNYDQVIKAMLTEMDESFNSQNVKVVGQSQQSNSNENQQNNSIPQEMIVLSGSNDPESLMEYTVLEISRNGFSSAGSQEQIDTESINFEDDSQIYQYLLEEKREIQLLFGEEDQKFEHAKPKQSVIILDQMEPINEYQDNDENKLSSLFIISPATVIASKQISDRKTNESFQRNSRTQASYKNSLMSTPKSSFNYSVLMKHNESSKQSSQVNLLVQRQNRKKKNKQGKAASNQLYGRSYDFNNGNITDSVQNQTNQILSLQTPENRQKSSKFKSVLMEQQEQQQPQKFKISSKAIELRRNHNSSLFQSSLQSFSLGYTRM